jgi:hypothetical protein
MMINMTIKINEANILAVSTFDTSIAEISNERSLEQIINQEIDIQKPKKIFPEGMACGIDGC